MSTASPSLGPNQRAFNCPSCKGRIVIPADLPPTTGPCPHCQATITSPAPEAAVTPTSTTTPVAPSSKPVEPKPSEPASAKATESKPQPSPAPQKKSSKTGLLVALLFLVLLGAGGAFAYLKFIKPKSEVSTLNLPKNLPAPSNPVLQKYLTAKTVEDKLPLILNAEALQAKIQEFYQQHPADESKTLASAFFPVKLPEQDSNKGFSLFTYKPAAKTSPSAQATETPKILAFIKDTPGGKKLDWEIFTQTKYRTLKKFSESRTVGKTEVFRVILSTANQAAAIYHVTDPAYPSDHVKASPLAGSATAQALSQLDASAARTATVELEWIDDAQNPQIQIKRLICWEFLGLGNEAESQ